MRFGAYINCKTVPFIDLIAARLKPYETRSRDTLGALIGKRIDLIETGKGAPVILARATVKSSTIVCYEDVAMRAAARILGTPYDIKPGQTKVFYELVNVRAVKPHPVPTNRINHGRAYTEYEGR